MLRFFHYKLKLMAVKFEFIVIFVKFKSDRRLDACSTSRMSPISTQTSVVRGVGGE
nr:hypothetical protein HUO10_000982 [Paraburkholderia busanensis]